MRNRTTRRIAAGRTSVLTILLAVTGVLAISGSASAATQPIEGVWNFQNGQVLVQPVSGAFQGTVTEATTFGSCSHPAGQVIWQMKGSGTSYTGTHVWFRNNSCEPFPGGESTWKVDTSDPTQYKLTFCTAHPGTGAPDPTATPQKWVGNTECFLLTRAIAPNQEPNPPGNTSPPTTSGGQTVGSTVTCGPGGWTNNPTGYSFQWYRDGTAIQGATSSSYTVTTADEGAILTCTVTAYNGGGSTTVGSKGGITVTVPTVAGCPAATGGVKGRKLGLVRLGMTRAQARKAYTKSSTRGSKYRDFFCLTPIGVRVGYASPTLTSHLSAKLRQRISDRVVWASTSNVRYAIKGIRAGTTIKVAAKKLAIGRPFHIGKNYWYLAHNGAATAVFKVRKGIVQEVGIADNRLTTTRAAERMLMRSFY